MKKGILILKSVLIIGLLFTWTACEGNQSQETTGKQNQGPQTGQRESGQQEDNETVTNVHKGIDVSHFNGNIDWQSVRSAGYTFAIAKATEGMDLADPMFATNWTGMKAAGIIRGAYHFYVTEDDPRKQAEFFISKVSLEKGDFIPVVDIEAMGEGTGAKLVEQFRLFIETLQIHYGVKPMIYTDTDFWDDNMNNQFGMYPLWIAEYDADKPKLPNGWKNWTLWQWNANGAVAGVQGDVDLDKLNPGMSVSSIRIK